MGVVLGKWVTISTTYAGGAKGEIAMAISGLFLTRVKMFRT